MLDMLRKILATEKTVIPTGILFQDTDNTLLGEKTQLSQKIKRIFRGSLANTWTKGMLSGIVEKNSRS
jgi:hypothetical protein